MQYFLFCIVSFWSNLFLHRYSVKMFTMSRGWEKFLCLFRVTRAHLYLNARALCYFAPDAPRLQRHGKDPHTPHFFKDVSHDASHTRFIRGYLTIHFRWRINLTGIFPNTPVLTESLPVGLRAYFCRALYYFYIVFATHWWMFCCSPFISWLVRYKALS